mmetsp:Transcript_12998/g.32810  ORF Transcript_12998/g.32810 Transcript_12998/m.32810 type:complete len:291 (+) Transcript_12998:50-922(+)|eukprot:CAMPEP_0116102868 /NCGR_PEP_ID=MMETSP0327-20121206/13583_1 /TAXON_ID=44447 /ORGANISM="Pseudo-nitzschia delicatissima, Strain B596" /LENGTH=290 /DNA_ID=CAMNT_0003594945 /DNA_START=1 /DNA_END=873 /DNA_ORIENTATION=+
MKMNTMMHDEFAAYYSDLTTTAPDQLVTFETSYTTDSRIDEVDDPLAKTIDVLTPVRKRQGFGEPLSKSKEFETFTANKIYTKELVDTRKARRNSASYKENTFDNDLRECILEDKLRKLKFEGTPAPAPTKGVRFGQVTIREYPIRPGVNPGGSKGCPLTLEWTPVSTDVLDLDVFESFREEHRRPQDQLKLVSAHREQILKKLGFSRKAILEGTRSANLARRGRYTTIARLKSTDSEEMIEGIEKKLKNLASFGRNKRREQKFLAPYTEKNLPQKPTRNLAPLARVFAE